MAAESGIRPLQRFFKLLELDRKDIYYVYLYAIFSGLITLSLPLGVQAIIGLIAGGSISASLVILVLMVTLGTALPGILKVMQLMVTETLQRRIFTRSAFDFAYRIPRLKLDSIVNYHAPELVNRFFDTLTLQKGVPKILMDFSTAVLQIAFGLILISFYHPFFVFFGVLLAIILLAIFRLTGGKGLKTSLKESKYKYEVVYWLEELARTMSTFKLSGDSALPMRKTDELVSEYLESRKSHFKILLFQYNSIVAFETIITASLLFLGSYLVMENQINIGQFVAAEIVIILILASVEKLIMTMEVIYDVLTALEKLGGVTDLPLEKEGGANFAALDKVEGMHLSIKDVSFRFEDAPQPTLNGITMDVLPGEKVCIAGYNRAGKSTLLKLISGMYFNYNGSISYNGYPLQNINLASLRKVIGDFSADEDIFKGTVLENITVSCPGVPLEKVVAAVKSVGVDTFIEGLSDGYQTMLLPQGRNIPTSVRTRILLARCIVSRPQLLSVYGFFPGLEQREREEITRTLINGPWTMVAVTDDPGLASRCDKVIIMKDGCIVDEGTFAQIKRSPHFSQVFLASPRPEPAV